MTDAEIEYDMEVKTGVLPPQSAPVDFTGDKMQINGKDIAVAEGDGVKGKIGVLIFATFGGMKVPKEEVDAWWAGQDAVPMEIKPVPPGRLDAYKAVCAADNTDIWFQVDQAAAEEFEKLYGQRVRVDYLSLPTKDGRNEYVLCRRIWVVDAQQGQAGEVELSPEHPKIARLKLDMGADHIIAIPFPGFENSPMVQEIERVANEEYQKEKKVVSGQRHRGALYRLVEMTGGVGFGYGVGTYFVPNEGERSLKGYKTYLTDVARKYGITGHTTDIRVMPVVDTEEMRDDIARDVAREVSQRYNDLLNSTLAYLEEKKDVIDEKQLARIDRAVEERLRQASELKILKGNYEKLLSKKISIKIAKQNLPENASGRTKALLAQMAEMVEE